MDNQTSNSNNKAMNHIAVSVPDLDKAVKWYHEVLGFNILTKQIEGKSDNSHLGKLFVFNYKS
jgi:catechol 2,3-dioxygenase-like lactoylglutathione lyase family enzyme